MVVVVVPELPAAYETAGMEAAIVVASTNAPTARIILFFIMFPSKDNYNVPTNIVRKL